VLQCAGAREALLQSLGCSGVELVRREAADPLGGGRARDWRSLVAKRHVAPWLGG
jgi:hypothetical protein